MLRDNATTVTQSYHARILKVMMHVQENLDQPLSLEQLAGIAHFSPYHFHRIFSAMVGESLMTHVRRLRLERAAHHLALTNRLVSDIARDANYENHESFTRAFQNHFGITPSVFREQNQSEFVAGLSSNRHDLPATDAPDSAWPDVRIEMLQPIRVAFIRHLGPYQNAALSWQELGRWAASVGLQSCENIGVAYDDPELTPEDLLRYDACMKISEEVPASGKVAVKTIPGGQHAVLTHVGAYETLGNTFARLYGKWLPASGREPGDQPPLLRYLTPMYGIPKEQQRTDVCIPLEAINSNRFS